MWRSVLSSLAASGSSALPISRSFVTTVVRLNSGASNSRGSGLVDFTLLKSTESFSQCRRTGLEPTRKYSCMNSKQTSLVYPTTPTVVTIGGVTSRIICTEAMSTSQDKLKIIIFYSSIRPGRMVDRVGTFVKQQVEAKGMEAILLDPEVLPIEMVKVPLHFQDPANAPQWMLETDATIRDADGFLIITAEYNCGVPPALSNLIDHFPPTSYRHRPVGIVTYSVGTMGGVRAGIVLRPMLGDLGMLTVPATAMVPFVQNAFDAEGKCLEERVATNIGKVVDDLEWYGWAIKNHKSVKPL